MEFTKRFLSDLPQRIFFCNKMPISLKVWRVMPKVCFGWSQALKNNDGIRISRGIYLKHCFPESATWYIRDTHIIWLLQRVLIKMRIRPIINVIGLAKLTFIWYDLEFTGKTNCKVIMEKDTLFYRWEVFFAWNKKKFSKK